MGRCGAVRLCLDRGADVNLAHEDTSTPMFAACENNHVEVARLLLERGADMNLAIESGFTPLQMAKTRSHAVMAAWLEQIQRVGWTCHLSEPRYKLVVLRALVARGQALRERTFHGKELSLDFLFPCHSPPQGNKQAKRSRLHLPDDLFPLVARYYGGGGMSAEEEVAAAAEAAAREAAYVV